MLEVVVGFFAILGILLLLALASLAWEWIVDSEWAWVIPTAAMVAIAVGISWVVGDLILGRRS